MASLFETPTAYWDSTDGPVNLGSKFTVSTATKISAGRYWKGSAANNGLVITMTLYGSTTTAIATATRTQLASDPIGWINVPFPNNVDLTTGVEYTIAFLTTGTNYTAASSIPLTAFTSPPFSILANHAVYGYGALAKPTAAGGWAYVIDVVTADTVVVPPPKSIMALDTDNVGLTQAWFNARYAEGVKMFITSGTPWSATEPVTLNVPRTEVQSIFAMAIAAGMKIGLYTRNPNHYNAGLDAAGPYINQLQFFALDVEPDPGTPVTQAMINGVVARGVRPIIYAGSSFWATVQGSNTTAFSSYPLWDTNADDTFDYSVWKANPNVMSPTPIPYGGWNVPGNYRVGVQQKFEHVIDGIAVDLNSFDESFLITTPSGPVADAGSDRTVEPWQVVTLTATGTGVWSQVSGTTVALNVSGSTLSFTAPASMTEAILVFAFGSDQVSVTVSKAKHAIVVDGKLVPIRMTKVT